MALAIPELTSPMQSVSACANGISLIDHTSLKSHVPNERTEQLAKLDNGSYLRLLRELVGDDKCHFHLELYAREYVESAEANSTLDEISKVFDDALLGKTLPLNFNSRFRLTQTPAPLGMISPMGIVGVNIGGLNGTLSSATVRLADSVYRELKWQQSAPKANEPTRLEVELKGTLGLIPISANIFEIVVDRGNIGFQRLVNPTRPVFKIGPVARPK
jgi:hypothetical protein